MPWNDLRVSRRRRICLLQPSSRPAPCRPSLRRSRRSRPRRPVPRHRATSPRTSPTRRLRTTRRSSSPAIAPSLPELDQCQARIRRLHRHDLRRGYRQIPRHQHRRVVQPHPRHHDHPRDHRRRPATSRSAASAPTSPRAAQRRAGRDRLDRPHRCAEHQPRGRPRPVPDRAVHPADRQQEPDRRACSKAAPPARSTCAARGRSTSQARTSPTACRRIQEQRRRQMGLPRLAARRARTFGRFRHPGRRRRRAQQGAGPRASRRSAGPIPTSSAGAMRRCERRATPPAAATGRSPAPCRPMRATGSPPGHDDRPGVPARAQSGRDDPADRQRPDPAPRPSVGRIRRRRTGSTPSSASNTGRATTLHFYVDSHVRARRRTTSTRIDMNWVGRNGAAIPLNTTVRPHRLQPGLRRHQRHLCQRAVLPRIPARSSSTSRYWGVNPGMRMAGHRRIKLDLSANYTQEQVPPRVARASLVDHARELGRHGELRQQWRRPDRSRPTSTSTIPPISAGPAAA